MALREEGPRPEGRGLAPGGETSTMRVAVEFRDESQGFEVAAGQLIDAWDGPAGLPEADVRARIAATLEQPRDFPPLRRAVVPGDRVVIPLDADVPGAA